MLTYCIVIIFVIINQLNACNNICEYTQDNPNKRCFGKAQECMLLRCGLIGNYPTWKRQTNNQTVTIINGSSGLIANLSNNYYTNYIQELNITSLRGIDTGFNSFIATDRNKTCTFNVFSYDLTNRNGTLTILDEAKPIDSTDTFNIQLGTFSQKINFTYQYEALPLDYLTWNDTKLETNLCEGTFPSLNCLVASEVDLKIKKCTKTSSIFLSYGFDVDFTQVQVIETRNFTHNIVFTYPPQTVKRDQVLTFTDADASKDLKCEVECANPDILTYEFMLLNDTVKTLLQNGTKDTYTYKIDQEDEQVKIVCTVFNSIPFNQAFKNESQTYFYLAYQNPIEVMTTDGITTTLSQDNSTESSGVTSTGKPLTDMTSLDGFNYTTVVTSISISSGHSTCEPVVIESTSFELWVIIVIAIACVLVLIVVVLLIFLVYFLIRRSGSYKKERQFTESTLEFDKESKQRQLNDGLQGNPVYVTTNPIKSLSQSSPLQNGRSDQKNIKLQTLV